MEDDDAQDRYVRALQATVTYQVGELVIRARSSLKDALALPWRLYQMHRLDRRASHATAGVAFERESRHKLPASTRQRLLTLDLVHADTADITRLSACLAESELPAQQQAESLLQAAELTVSGHPALGASLVRLAMSLNASPAIIEQAAFLLYRAGNLSEPADMLQKHPGGRHLARQKILDEYKLLRDGPSLPSINIGYLADAPSNRILYVSHLSLPHHTSGYATRTHSLLLALSKQGFNVTCVTRPGYPWDRRDSRAMMEAALEQQIERVRYLHLRGLSVGETPSSVYIESAADQLSGIIEQENPTVVIAGSNHVNALPALIAARSTGRPFFYDIRGLWEFTSASKMRGWEQTERFHLSRQLETRVASEATGVFAISSPVKEELMNRGVPGNRITILPNGVDIDRFSPGPEPEGLRQRLELPPHSLIFGFIGSMEAYEGIDDLIQAFGQIVSRGVDAHLLLVGDGPVARQAGDRVGELGIVPRVRFVGRVPFAEVPQYYRLCDIFVYPRIDMPLTRLVPALKPLEAMATGKPVVVSDLPALFELVGGRGNACLVPSHDVDTLANQMERLARDPAERAKVAAAGQHHARSRTWEISTSSMARILFEQPPH
ncbi:glycosyltransferase family 4 protein [Stappia sp. MMSF_3263]|uniref:glycosyltransferase family 4 protein n=1 Tax=Stappia sp. MMSF_3263 TaxID=3046693 RepID=UPI00273D3F8A|nr:glycosyltransferase family 4 protein [Stappia sp. MMSF_3263]